MQGVKGGLFTEVAQKAQDQSGADAPLGLSVLAGARKAMNHGLHRHAALGVGLRVKKDFCTHHVVSCGALEIRHGHVVEVLLLQQNTGPGVVDVQKTLQIGESVGRTQRLHIGIRQLHTIALGQRKDQLGLQRAFNVHVQLCLGHGAQQRGNAVGRYAGNRRGHCVGHQQTPKVTPLAFR